MLKFIKIKKKNLLIYFSLIIYKSKKIIHLIQIKEFYFCF